MQFFADLLSALPPKADIQHCAANLTTPGRQFPADKMLPSGPVDITSSAIAFGAISTPWCQEAPSLSAGLPWDFARLPETTISVTPCRHWPKILTHHAGTQCFGIRLSPSAAEPDLHLHFNRPEVAPHLLAHRAADLLRERDECLPGRACALLVRREVGVKGGHHEAMGFRRNLHVAEICGLGHRSQFVVLNIAWRYVF
jgi:hypothetical protein